MQALFSNLSCQSPYKSVFIRNFADESFNERNMISINNYEEFAQYEGQELGRSQAIHVTQERINQFADATIDHQWIHVDEERCKAESPFGQTIAHGYLTLSLLPVMWNQIIEVHNLERQMNYGMDELKFAQPVLSGQHVFMTATLAEIMNLRGAIKTTVHITIWIEETGKKAVDGLATFVYYFKQ